ncbi:conserved hypothetical protein [Burkholderia ambifaria MEX-5]|uniref:Uncharacterized protein n=1 Tax=Burkholderia ambifaria MEX-5 TaxID=396597 RepID=B1TC34_9BURK|nr:conserved hypothetical protein [Burkholderia ambifaria MEX-5]
MTRGLRGSGARSASRDLSSMLTPIVRPVPGARHGVPLAALAQAAAYADPSGSATSHVASQAAPRSVARRGDAPLPPEVAVAEPIVLDGDASATPADPMGWLPLYCAERRPRERAARRIAALCGHLRGRVASARPTRDQPPRRASRAANAEWGGDPRTRYRVSMAANRAFGCAWCLSRARNDSGGTRRGDDGVVNRAARDDIAGSAVVRAASTTCSTRMTSLRMPTTRRGATPAPRTAGNGDKRRRRASCTMSCTA